MENPEAGAAGAGAGTDGELTAILAAYNALKWLEPEALERSFTFLASKLGVKQTLSTASKKSAEIGTQGSDEADTEKNGLEIESFPSAAEYLAEFPNTLTESERALIVSAYLQKKNGLDGLNSFDVNTELKNLGYGASNITVAMGALVKQKPQLMVQLRKSGTSRQAKKTYKVTEAGFKFLLTIRDRKPKE